MTKTKTISADVKSTPEIENVSNSLAYAGNSQKKAEKEIKNFYYAETVITVRAVAPVDERTEKKKQEQYLSCKYENGFEIRIPLEEFFELDKNAKSNFYKAVELEGAYLDVLITDIKHIEEGYVYASKSKVDLQLQEYWVNDPTECRLKEGMIIPNCKVQKVLRKLIEVNVYGLTTSIPIAEVSWNLMGYEAIKELLTGSCVNVYIKEVNKIKGKIKLHCSIREADKVGKKAYKENIEKFGNMKNKKQTLGKIVDIEKKGKSNYYYISTIDGYNAIAEYNDPYDNISKNLNAPLRTPMINDEIIFQPTIYKENNMYMYGAIVRII